MDNLEKSFPNGVLSFYIELYTRRKGETNSKCSGIHRQAMKSWISLSKSEKQFFLTKFNDHRTNFKKNIALHLKNAEPYLKSKIRKPMKTNSVTNDNGMKVDKQEYENKTNSCKLEEDKEMDVEDHISFIQQNEINNQDIVNIGPVIDSPVMCSKLQTEAVLSLPEPTPPKIKTAKELFSIIKEREDNNAIWEQLSRTEKSRYQLALQSIKRKYLMGYRKYLEHLTPEKLFEHYQNTINSN